MNDELRRMQLEIGRIAAETGRALYAAASMVPAEDYQPFIDFARKATLRHLEESRMPIGDIDAHFRHLVGVYLMNVTQPGKVLH